MNFCDVGLLEATSVVAVLLGAGLALSYNRWLRSGGEDEQFA